MNWLSLLTWAAVVAVALSALAGEAAGPVNGSRAYADFPFYPAGFSSYQGLGYQGSCCERVSPEAVQAWEGYGAEEGPAPRWNLFRGCGRGLGLCARTRSCCAPSACDPCGGCGANFWPTSPCGPTLFGRLHSLHAGCCGFLSGLFGRRCGGRCGGCGGCDDGGVPTSENPVMAVPEERGHIPTPAAPRPPATAVPHSTLPPPPPATGASRATDSSDPTSRPGGLDKSASWKTPWRPYTLLSF